MDLYIKSAILITAIFASLAGNGDAYGRIEMFTKTPELYRYEPSDPFWGHVALVEENISITCKIDKEGQQIWRESTELYNSSRVTVFSDGLWYNVTIQNIKLDEAGMYRCVGAAISLRVTDIGPGNPSRITEHTAYTHNGNIAFLLHTNVKTEDTVDWTISYNLSAPAMSDDQSWLTEPWMMKCSTLQIVTFDNRSNSLICMTEQSVDTIVAYKLNVNGTNPFTSQTTTYEGIIDPISLESLPGYLFEVPTPETTTVVPMYNYNIIEFRPPAIAYSHSDEVDSYRNFNGYAARKGDDVTYTCIPLPVNGVLYFNHTIKKDTRIKLDIDSKWRNTSITHVSFEDIGTYFCGAELTWLAVIDTEKRAVILKHACVFDGNKDDMVCTFYTNSKARDRVSWHITYTISTILDPDTKEVSRCGGGLCADLECNRLTAKFDLKNHGYDVITCSVEYIIVNNMYEFNLTAASPFNTEEVWKSSVLDHSIMIASSPDVVDSSVTANSALINVRYSEDSALLNYRVEGALSTPLIVYSQTASARLELTGLIPYTDYHLNVSCQFAATANPSIWSHPTNITILTGESTPDIPAKVSDTSYSFEPSNTACRESTRRISLFWKAIPMKAGAANGLITHYYVYELNNGQVADLSKPLVTVPGSQTSVSLCVTNERIDLGLKAATAVGLGKGLSNYTIPARGQVIHIQQCKIIAEVLQKPERVVIEWDGIALTGQMFYTVYWCKYDNDRNCVHRTLEWKSVNEHRLVLERSLVGYKFGLSAHKYSKERASGIIWAKCVNYPDGELHAASIDVELTGMEARVTVTDKCYLGSKTPTDDYLIQYCAFDAYKEEECSGSAVRHHLLSLCESSAQIELDKYSSHYAFWVISTSGNTKVESIRKFDQTPKKSLPIAAISVAILMALISTFLITILFVWLCRQRKLAKSMRHPQLVRPSNLHIEQLNNKDSEKDSLHYSSLLHIEPDTLSECNTLLNEEGTSSGEYLTVEKITNQLSPSVGYQPVPPTLQGPTQPWTDLNCQSSYGELPDDYVKQTSGSNFSAQLFYMDTSDAGNTIDLSQIVYNSPQKFPGSSSSSKLEYVKLDSCFDEGSRESDGECDDNEMDADLYCETDCTDLSSPDCSGGLSLPPE